MALSLAENFDEFFEIKLANTEELKNVSYKIRHTVYAEELGWEPINAEGIEVDECDPYAFSLLLVHKTLIRDVVDPDTIPRGRFGEISRLSVPDQFRRRPDEKNKPFVINEFSGGDIFSEEERRNFPNIAIGLYLSVIAMVNMCNHSHMFVVVEPRLNKRLKRLGLNFQQCGEELDYHGIRALFCLDRKDFTGNLNPEVFELYTLLEQQLVEQLVLHPY